uniref:Uncharacterized protein n=1 Tax=Ascaris lumbricoides TaxID=6252 RepID=A0A0M3HP84_ASCLU
MSLLERINNPNGVDAAPGFVFSTSLLSVYGYRNEPPLKPKAYILHISRHLSIKLLIKLFLRAFMQVNLVGEQYVNTMAAHRHVSGKAKDASVEARLVTLRKLDSSECKSTLWVVVLEGLGGIGAREWQAAATHRNKRANAVAHLFAIPSRYPTLVSMRSLDDKRNRVERNAHNDRRRDAGLVVAALRTHGTQRTASTHSPASPHRDAL